MKINMKGYNLESFSEKDIYTWEEILSTIEELESKIKEQEEKINNFEENYIQKQENPYLEYGVNENDF
jgi:hypothetical protein